MGERDLTEFDCVLPHADPEVEVSLSLLLSLLFGGRGRDFGWSGRRLASILCLFAFPGIVEVVVDAF
jgi:hypothetical protein